MKDILGKALLDYISGNKTENLVTETSISEEDEVPVSYFFRSYSEMPSLERSALDLAKGRILDAGCGSGSHSLYLQEKGLEVTAIDISEGAVETARLRGVHDVRQISLLDLKNEKFDTILLLMNGAGVFQKVKNIPKYLKHLKLLLSPDGQILVDSSDLQYMYDKGEDGGIWVPGNAYYGELKFTTHYKDLGSESFNWLYLDERLFKSSCEKIGLQFELLEHGENFDYLARITN
jgi:SAM-dependent methyltransferase